MKDLMSKEHHCYKILTLVMKSSAYPSSIDNNATPNMDFPQGSHYINFIKNVIII